MKSTRFWKWAVAYVCHNRNRSTHRITIPFVSEDTYGLKEVFQSNFWIVKSIQNYFRALQVELSCSLKSFFFRCDFCWFLTQIFETIRKHTKITTSARLWSPKPFAGVCEHTTPFVEKIRTYTKLQKLIWLQYDALNVIFSTIFAEFHVSKLQKSTLFLRLKVALKEYENGKNRYLRTFGSIEIVWRRVVLPTNKFL